MRRSRSIRVAGLAVRTVNASEMSESTAKIPGLWSRYMQSGWSDRLGSAGAAGPTMAVYSDYASDLNGPYRLLVGRELLVGAPDPQGVESVEIPAGPYLLFSFRGAMPRVVMDGWRRVWTHFEERRKLQRAYTADFEAYPEDGTGVDIWIAVREEGSIA
ncbi:MAG: GyrI-like domain-containing protein [Vicinamibacterales bacterium]